MRKSAISDSADRLRHMTDAEWIALKSGIARRTHIARNAAIRRAFVRAFAFLFDTARAIAGIRRIAPSRLRTQRGDHG